MSNDTYYGIRLRVLGGDIKAKVVGVAALPTQGYLLESTAILNNNSSGAVVSKKTLSAFKSLNFLPAMFDFGVYSGGDLP
jgi:hypothetical protein